MSNKNTYSRKDIIQAYAVKDNLFPAEATILHLLQDDLSEMKMLDIGVGGGRTTVHFAGLVKEYVGVDYSEEMITACRERFSDDHGNMSFEVCDARDMGIFQDDSFDFILFSYNSIDYISHADRLKALQEIRRVGKTGGYFLFSTHNINCIPMIFGLSNQIHSPARKILKNTAKWFLLNFVFNKPNAIKAMKNAPYAIFNDGAFRFGVQTYYIRPDEQIKQLTDGFKDVRVYLGSGREIESDVRLNSINDPWLHYLSVIK